MMAGRVTATIVAAAVAASAPGAAAAQMYLNQPAYPNGRIELGDPLIGLPVPGATPGEQRAQLLWNLRAGLNVAALQCQFSPYLRTVSNYNGLLAHHSEELADAYKTLNGYFTRIQGKGGQKAFDDYTTMTYNNFSTFHAQYGFCQTAADISKHALATPKGQLLTLAQNRMRQLRASLTPVRDQIVTYNPYLIPMPPVPPLSEECYDRRGDLRKECRTALWN